MITVSLDYYACKQQQVGFPPLGTFMPISLVVIICFIVFKWHACEVARV